MTMGTANTKETLATAVIGIILFFVGIGILINAISPISDFFSR